MNWFYIVIGIIIICAVIYLLVELSGEVLKLLIIGGICLILFLAIMWIWHNTDIVYNKIGNVVTGASVDVLEKQPKNQNNRSMSEDFNKLIDKSLQETKNAAEEIWKEIKKK